MSIVRKSGLSIQDLLGIGIAVPMADGAFSFAPSHFDAWNIFTIQEMLSAITGRSVDLINYGNAMGLSEYMTLQQTSHRILSIDVFETLISAGFISNGGIVPGCENMNIGHIVIDPNGFECSCGNKGCLAAMGTADAALKYYEYFSRQHVALEKWKKSLSENDLSAKYALDKCSLNLSIGIRNTLKTIKADLIVLGGDFILNTPLLYDKILEYIHRDEPIFPEVHIASQKEQSEAYGAAVFKLLNSSM